MNTKRVPAILLALLAASATMFYSIKAVQAATELARVNGTVITLEDFNKKYKENLKFFQYKAPTKQAVLDDLIKRELGIQEARRLKLDKDPEVIERMNTVLYHAVLDKVLSKQFETISSTDAEAKAFYAKNPEVRTSHIFVAVRPEANQEEDKAAFQKIKKIQDEALKDGKMGFAEAAQRYSEGVAAPMGGDLDYQTRDKLDPTYYETALKLKSPGKVSGIIRSQFGYHIVKLTAIRSWEETDKAQVKRMLFDEKRSQIFEKYMAQLKKQYKVSVKPDLVKN